MQVTPAQWQDLVDHFERALAKEPPDPADYRFAGLAPTAYQTLIEQGRRGGPILSMQRMLQAQAMCLRLVPIIGEEKPLYAYHFDLVGSMARTEGASDDFYDDIVWRATTAVCAKDIGPISCFRASIGVNGDHLSTPASMHRAGRSWASATSLRTWCASPASPTFQQYPIRWRRSVQRGCFATWEQISKH
jgi:hypothetical protein